MDSNAPTDLDGVDTADREAQVFWSPEHQRQHGDGPEAFLSHHQRQRQRRRQRKRRLLRSSELPPWYQHNEYILSGYRSPDLSTCDCAATLCAVHNETGNIWTHLVGGVVWVAVCSRALEAPELALRADELTFELHTVCYGLCGIMPFASALAHLFHCRGPAWYASCWSFDHFGIIALWFARAVLEGLVCLWCRRGVWVQWVMLTTMVFAAAGFFIVRHSQRVLFLPLYLYLHAPLLVMVASDEFWAADSAQLRGAVGQACLGSACGVVGYVVMISQVPEKWAPGKFDIWGHSHQWWHIFTTVGPVLCMEADRTIYKFRLDSTTC